jgi:hypothetical protein
MNFFLYLRVSQYPEQKTIIIWKTLIRSVTTYEVEYSTLGKYIAKRMAILKEKF